MCCVTKPSTLKGGTPSAESSRAPRLFLPGTDHADMGSHATRLLDGRPARPARRVTPELAQLDAFLNDPAMLTPLAAALDPAHGRPSLPVAQVLRLFYLQHRYQLSDRVVVQEVADSFHGRRFCHFGVTDPVPHPTSLTKWRHRLGPAGIAAVNAAVTHRLQAEQGLRGRRFRIDSTVTDADIHHPTDSGLLADGIRRLTRVARQVQAELPVPGPRIRDRARAAKRRILAIGKRLRRRTGDAVTQVR